MTSVSPGRPTVEVLPCFRDDDNTADHATPGERPDPRTALPIAGWFECHAAEFRSRGEGSATAEVFGLCADALDDLAVLFRCGPYRSARELIAIGPEPYRTIRLDALAVPADRATALASVLDDEARFFLDLGTDLGRLAAWALLRHAEAIEWHGAGSIADYYAAEDAEAALTMAVDLVFGGDYASLDNPLW